jgi:hypothetical protein
MSDFEVMAIAFLFSSLGSLAVFLWQSRKERHR